MTIRTNQGPVQPQGYGEDPLAHYTGIFLRFLQYVFASFDQGYYKWLADENLTEITITDQAPVERLVLDKRPAIVLVRGPVQYGNISMDQFRGYDPKTGAKSYVDLDSAVMTYNCIAREGLEAGRIAHIAAMATRRLKKTLLRAGMHRVGEEVTIGPESGPGALAQGDPRESTMVTVTVPFFYQDTWSIAPIDKTLLNDLHVNLRSERDATLKDPSMNGRPLRVEKTMSLTQRVQVSTKTK